MGSIDAIPFPNASFGYALADGEIITCSNDGPPPQCVSQETASSTSLESAIVLLGIP